MKALLKIIAGVILLGSALVALQLWKINVVTKNMPNHDLSIPFQRIQDPHDLNVLFMGDSTAVGIGSRPEATTAGWFAQDFPNSSIHNISQNGLKLAGLLNKLERVKEGDFDIIIFQIGANDIMKFTPYPLIERDLEKILSIAASKSKKVIILHSGNIGTAPIFIPPFSWIITARSYKMRDIYKAATKKSGAIYVDLIEYNADKTFLLKQDKYYANDRLHLSGDGYRLWYDAIRLYSKI